MGVNQVCAPSDGDLGENLQPVALVRKVDRLGGSGEGFASWPAKRHQACAHIEPGQFRDQVECHSLGASTLEGCYDLKDANGRILIDIEQRVVNHSKVVQG